MSKVKTVLALTLLKLSVKLCKQDHNAGITRTYTGRLFNILEPTFDMINVVDIAKGLAYKPHFSGFSPKYFSIAEHCLAVERAIAETNQEDYHARLQALLHDASEAYTGDMIKPLKNLLPNFVMIEKKLQSAIYARYGIEPHENRKSIKEIDYIIQDIEAIAFYKPHRDQSKQERRLVEEYIDYLTPDEAFRAFTTRFKYLISKIQGR